MSHTTTTDLDTIKRNLRLYESSLYTNIVQLQSDTNINDNNNNKLQQQIENDLSNMQSLIDKLSLLINNDNTTTNSQTSLLHTYNRYENVFNEFNNDYRKYKDKKQQQLNRQLLLQHNNNTTTRNKQDINTTHDNVLHNEGNGLQHSLRIADTLLDIGDNTSQSLQRQHSIITSANTRLQQLGKQFPTLNKLMSRIQIYKHRDNIILALVIASCIIFIIWYISNKG